MGTAQRAHSLRVAWSASGVVSALFIGLYVAQPHHHLGMLTVILELVAMTGALVTMSLCVAPAVGRERRIWLSLLGMTTVFWLGTAARGVWLVMNQFDSVRDPLRSLARWGVLPLLVPVVVMFAQSSSRNRLRGLRSSLDSLAMMVGVSGLTFYSVLVPERTPMRFAPSAQADRFVLALVPSAALCVAVYLLVLRRRPFAAWRGCVTVGLFAGLLSIMVHDISMITGGSGLGNVVRTGAGHGLMIAAFLLLALAGVYRMLPDPRPSESPSIQRAAPPVWTGLIGSLVSLAGLLLLLNLVLGARTGTERVFAAASMAVVAVVIVGKETVVAFENHVLADDAMADPITGLFSRRRFMESLPREVTRSVAEGTPLSLCVIEIIDLTAVNNAYGYATGDAELRRMGELLSSTCGGMEMAARIGGDQLALVLPSTTAEEACEVCRGIVSDLSAATSEAGTLRLAVGVAEAPRHALDVEGLMHAATGAVRCALSMSEQDVVLYDPLLSDLFDHEAQIARLEIETRIKTVETLAAAVDARDHHTRHHSQNTADLSRIMAEMIGLSQERADMVHIAGLLHDVGKIGVSDKVLLKAGPLTPHEIGQIQSHSALGVRIMRTAVDEEILSWVRAHHERWDGTGYPDRLAGESIPLEARILAVCDSFDAMRSDRSYRNGMSIEDALAELRACSGSQFDPTIVGLLTEAVRGGQKSWFEGLVHPRQTHVPVAEAAFVGNLPG